MIKNRFIKRRREEEEEEEEEEEIILQLVLLLGALAVLLVKISRIEEMMTALRRGLRARRLGELDVTTFGRLLMLACFGVAPRDVSLRGRVRTVPALPRPAERIQHLLLRSNDLYFIRTFRYAYPSAISKCIA